jgi:hypothetical protein
MDGKVLFLAAVLMGTLASANEVDGEIAAQLNAKRILDILPSQCVGPNLATPVAVRYVRNGDSVPSCGLLLKNNEYVDLVSPESGGSVPACAAPLSAPTYLTVKDSYLVYEYQVEDPRSQITRMFQLYRINGDQVNVCKNDDQLTDFAKKSIKAKGVENSFKNALMKFGCAQ